MLPAPRRRIFHLCRGCDYREEGREEHSSQLWDTADARGTTCVTLNVQPWEQGPQQRDQQDGLERAKSSPSFISATQGSMACLQQHADTAAFKA